MEDKEAEKATQMMRIFVGGLGESVTAEDLQRLFGSLGMVQGLDIVRSKSRSFAYVDFSPPSLKSHSKLFSTYNGCVWKGGRLKLEKAKEHYLVRLKQEWAEQAELASKAPDNGFDANEDIASSNKPKKDLNLETKQLRIYFPSLRKVKVLPLSGSGKHKYSFQNVEVPPLPIHFCDCEEHSIDPHPAKEKQTNDLEAQSGGMNEEEINIMNSVMNKLFEREKVSDAAHSGNGQAKERDNSAKLISGLQFDENEADSETDEDNLIINVVKRKNNRIDLLGVQEKEQISENQDISGKRTSKDGQNQNALKEQKRNTVLPNKKRKSLNQESDENGSLSAITRGKGKLKTHSDESAVLGAQLAEPESGIQQSAPVVSWSQKSSWRALVGDKSNTSFSVSHILPGIASSKEQQPKFDGSSVPDSTVSKNDNLVRHGDHLESHSSETIKEVTETQPAKPSAASSNSGKRSFIKSVIQSFLPGIALKLFLIFLPAILMIMSKFEGFNSLSSLERRSTSRYYLFNFVNVFLGSIIAGSAFEQLNSFIHQSANKILKTIGVAIPMRTTFFITSIMVDGWAGIAGEILMLKPLIVYHLKNFFLVKTEKDREEAMDPGSLGFNTGEPRIQFYLLLGLVYATVTPIVLPFIIIFFGLAYVVFRHQIINVYNQEYESAAAFWPDVHGRVISELVISQVLLLGLMSTKKAAQSTPFLIALPILTIWFNRFCKGRYEAAFVIYPLQEAMMKDTLEWAKEPNLNLKGYLQNAYVHPVFKASEDEEDDEINDDRWENESVIVIVPTKRQSRRNTPAPSKISQLYSTPPPSPLHPNKP